MMNKMRTLIVLLTGLVCASWTVAQGDPPDPSDYRRFFRKPTTPEEFWTAIKFEMDVGRRDLAAKLITGLKALNPTADQLEKLHQKIGFTPLLRLRVIRKWFEIEDLPKKDQADKVAAQKKVDQLNQQTVDALKSIVDDMIKAVNAKRSDPDRIKLFTKNLAGTKEQRQFALKELRDSGPVAVPHLLNELESRSAQDGEPILESMSLLKSSTVPVLLAALDSPNAKTRRNIIRVLRSRSDFTQLDRKGMNPIPFLWPLASSLEPSSVVRQDAKEALAILYDIPVERLPLPRVELTREAEKYYQNAIRFPDTPTFTVWRWINKQLVRNDNFTKEAAEKYYALRFAGKALALDPNYKPAQMVSLLTILDNGYVTPKKAEDPIGELKPSVKTLLTSVKPELLMDALSRALRDNNPKVALACIWSLGEKRSKRAGQATTDASSPIIRSLFSGDRRVQMAAIEALLKIPQSQSLRVKTQILEILRSNIKGARTTKAQPRIMVAIRDTILRNETLDALSEAGYDAVVVVRPSELIPRLRDASDIDALLLDPSFPRSGVAHLLGQLRVGVKTRRVPILLGAVPTVRRARDILTTIAKAQREKTALQNIADDLRATAEANVLSDRVREALSEKKDRFTVARARRIVELQEHITRLDRAYREEVNLKHRQLRQITRGHRNLLVVDPDAFANKIGIQSNLTTLIQATGSPMITAQEQTQLAERSMELIGKMAQGQIKGFNLTPLREDLLEVSSAKKLSENAQLAAIHALGTMTGTTVHRELTTIVLDDKRKVEMRLLASEKLQAYFQQHGIPSARYRERLIEAFATALRQPNVDGKLQAQLRRLIASMSSGAGRTGNALRGFNPELPPAKP